MLFTVGGASYVTVGQSVVYDEDRCASTVVSVEQFCGYVWLTLEIGLTLVKAEDDLVLVIVVSETEYFYNMYQKFVDDRHLQYEEECAELFAYFEEDEWFMLQDEMEQ